MSQQLEDRVMLLEKKLKAYHALFAALHKAR